MFERTRIPLASVLVIAPLLAAESSEEPPGGRTSAERGPDAALEGSLMLAGDPTRDAVERGLAFLAAQQRLLRDGSFPSGEYKARVGVAALATLAFLAEGSTTARGPYKEEVAAAVDYLLSRVAPPDSKYPGFISDRDHPQSQMHGHGLATLALAQAYSTSPLTARGRRTAAALTAAVRRIEESQGLEGGWQYKPYRQAEHEGSVTVCLVQALRAARNAGIHVDTDVIARAVDYVERLQEDSGGFRYQLIKSGKNDVTVALTGACLSTLHATGVYDGRAVDDGYDYIWRELTRRDVGRERGELGVEPSHPYYERFYLSQALWHHRDTDAFEPWAAAERRRILTRQAEDGSWKSGRYGECYATAMNCLFLSLPEGLLPIFQR